MGNPLEEREGFAPRLSGEPQKAEQWARVRAPVRTKVEE